MSACVEGGFVVEADCDEVMQQFDDFIHTCVKGELEKFCVADDRLDTILRSRMAANYPKAWSVCGLALLLSHGQASVERGFSVNKELVIENQSKQTLAARRIIKDHIIHVDGVTNVEITRNVVARSAKARHANYLAQQKEEQEAQKRNKKRKEETHAIHELEGKRKRLKTDVSSLVSTSKELYEKCEKSGELPLVTKANALRRRAEEKQQEVEVLDREIAERLLATKQ